MPPEEDLLAGVTPERTPAGCRYHLWVANLTPNRRMVPLALHAPAIGDRVLSLSIEPYSTLSRTVEGSFSPGQPHSGDVTLRAGGRTLAFAYLYPLVEDGSFERDGTPLPDAAAGARVARVGPGKGWQGRYRILNLAPEHRYRVTVRGRRMGPRGEAFGLVRVKDGAGQWHHTGLAFAKDAGAAWAPLTAEFDTPAELAAADVYLYNHNSEDAVEYDGLEVEMLR